MLALRGHVAGLAWRSGSHRPAQLGREMRRCMSVRVADVREAFLAFHEERGHQRMPSSSVVPDGDSTLLFTSAGMVQFKDQILGRASLPPALATEGSGPWLTSVQKCIRAGGKGCDLHEIGASPRHLSFFEMCGSFHLPPSLSAEEERESRHTSMTNALHFLTKRMGLDASRIKATVLQGDKDTQAFWQAKLGKHSVYECGFADNWWTMGTDRGVPCGPCTELFYDFSSHVPGSSSASSSSLLPPDDPNCMEVWNLVFMQHEHPDVAFTSANDQPAGSASTNFSLLAGLPLLPRGACIDTGMGLERLTSVVQGVQNSAFEIDVLATLITAVRDRVLSVSGQGSEKLRYADFSSAEHRTDEAVRNASVSLRVIADHLRSASIILADGVVPSATGRGHVLRRIIRRSVLHGRLLGITDKPFLASLVPDVVATLGDAYPELSLQEASIASLLDQEEQLCLRTMNRGIKALEEELERTEGRGARQVASRVVRELHDTLGLPAELTEIFCQRRGFQVNMEEVAQLIEEQREISRSSWSGGANDGRGGSETVGEADLERMYAARNTAHTSLEASDAVLLAVEKKADGTVRVTMDPCPFYAEGGGQVGDVGTLALPGLEEAIAVVGCKSNGGIVQVELRQASGSPLAEAQVEALAAVQREGSTVVARVDEEARAATCRNHSATHLLHAALRQALGSAVHQAGSYVGPDRLRFDFTFPKALSSSQIEEVEALVRRAVAADVPVVTREHGYEEALGVGAICQFSDKRSSEEKVRVVSMGEGKAEALGLAEGGAGGCGSREWCGGTHVTATGDIRPFVITSERSVAAGTRRIEALTGAAAEEHLREHREVTRSAASVLRSSPEQLVEDVKASVAKEREMAVQIEQLKCANLRLSLPTPIRGELGGKSVLVYDTALRKMSAGKEDKGKKGSLVQLLRLVAPTVAAEEAGSVHVLADQQVALIASSPDASLSAREALDLLLEAVPGAKRAGKPSDHLAMLLLPASSPAAHQLTALVLS